MSTAVWPPIDPEDLIKEEEASLAHELDWLLSYLQESLASLKSGLEECAALLSPDKGASTLVLSSLRSESIKGYVTRVGARILKGDVALKFATPPSSSRGSAVAAGASQKLTISGEAQAPTLTLEAVTAARSLINASLDVIDVTAWTGDATDAGFIAGQLRLLFENVQEARQTLKGTSAAQLRRRWWEDAYDESVFDPPCPPTISFHLSIADAALVLQVRALEPANTPPHADSITGFGIRDRLAVALGQSKTQTHEEIGETFVYRGREVRVKEKHRVESQDPALLSAMAKLSGLEHSVAMSRRALDTVMGKCD
ncbi:MAG: hypothetical protein M1828_001686 [Chrysothrix sp. TS-e1954]|nr:MAG: hypothetical protein M1828_001686 [Chrysothrix sp. TS-e1954]